MSTNRKIEIYKAELKSDLFIKSSYHETVGKDTDQVTRDCSAPAHDDLRKLFRQLIPHLALITEQVRFDDVHGRCASKETPEENPDADQRENLMDPDGIFRFSDADWKIVTAMRCTEFCIKGNGDGEGVSLSGDRTLSNGKSVGISAPTTKYIDDVKMYALPGYLAELMETMKSEVYAYLFESKHAPDKQLVLFPADEEDDADEEETEQERMDREMPLTDEMAAKAAKKSGKKAGNKPKADKNKSSEEEF